MRKAKEVADAEATVVSPTNQIEVDATDPLINSHLVDMVQGVAEEDAAVDHLRPTTDKAVKMYCYISPPKMYWYTLGQTVVALAHRYRQTTNNVDRELTKLP